MRIFTSISRVEGLMASLVAELVKNLCAMQETPGSWVRKIPWRRDRLPTPVFAGDSDGKEDWVRSLGWEDPLEKGMAAHSSILAWRIPRTEEPDGLQSMGSPRVGHDTAGD